MIYHKIIPSFFMTESHSIRNHQKYTISFNQNHFLLSKLLQWIRCIKLAMQIFKNDIFYLFMQQKISESLLSTKNEKKVSKSRFKWPQELSYDFNDFIMHCTLRKKICVFF